MKLDGKSLQESIKGLIDEYKFEPHQVLDIVKMGIKSAFRKQYLGGDKKIPIQVAIDKEGNITIYREYTVVTQVEDSAKEMQTKEAKKYKKDIKKGETLYVDITPEDLEFSRIAVQAAAQTIKQNMKKIERERFFEKFKDKEGEVLKAKVLRNINENVLLDVEGTTVLLPPEGQIPNKMYNAGEEIIVLLRQISKGPDGVTLDLTQSSNDFVEVILKKTVPELEDGSVQLLKIVRFPGKRTKVLVDSDDERIDPVGVFVGQYGSRINNILSLLDGEKIEFVQNYEDPKMLVAEAMKPAQIKHVEINDNQATVYVNSDQKAVAIGKSAVNLKLASKITGYRIDVQEASQE